jgi:hypothetical protein
MDNITYLSKSTGLVAWAWSSHGPWVLMQAMHAFLTPPITTHVLCLCAPATPPQPITTTVEHDGQPVTRSKLPARPELEDQDVALFLKYQAQQRMYRASPYHIQSGLPQSSHKSGGLVTASAREPSVQELEVDRYSNRCVWPVQLVQLCCVIRSLKSCTGTYVGPMFN